MFCKKDALQTWNKPTGEQQYRMATSAKLRLNISGGLLLHVKRVLKDLNYKMFSFTVAKINLFILKMNK